MAKSALTENRKLFLVGTVTFAVSIAVGVVIGYFSRSRDPEVSRYSQDGFGNEGDLINRALEDVDSDSLRSFLQELSKEPHIAGLRRDNELTEWIRDEWLKAGLDRVELATYDFYLSFPNQTNPNKITLIDPNGDTVFTSKHQEDVVREGDSHPDFVHAFNAHAPADDVDGLLVYVNYGTVEDIAYLESIDVSLEGMICIARYGAIFRGNKLENCQVAGAIGIILFSDPADVAPASVDPSDVYPHSIFLPESGMQRGSVFMDNGDPLSPFWPSVPNAYRPKDASLLPTIPCQPIGYGDAKVLMEKMGGPTPPDAWKGKIGGIDYRIGGEMLPEFQGWTVHLSVHNYEDDVKSSNVIGYLVGDVEPDRYVYLGNHRDAWGYGALDPSSGTANLMEVARVLGRLKKNGWKPRRTIVFCSWAAEEYGLMGSEEWVQEKVDKIMARSVGLLNTDTCISGPIPGAAGSPSFKNVILNSLKSVPNGDSSGSLYDAWYDWLNQDVSDSQQKVDPQIDMIGSGSDHANFIFYAGVPVIDISFNVDNKKDGVYGYPAYHTGYETFYMMDELIDPGFKIHKKCAQLSLHILFQLADSLIIPYDFQLLSDHMRAAMDDLYTGDVSTVLANHSISLEHVKDAIDAFVITTNEYASFLATLNTKSDPLVLKQVNDQIISLERVFILPQGLPGGRVKHRHALFSPAKFNVYGGSAFPGITDLLHRIDRLEGEELRQREEELKRHVSDLMIVIRNAASFLKPLYQI